MSAIALMTEKLKAALDPHDLSPPEGRPRRCAPQFDGKSFSFIHPHRPFVPSSSPQGKHDSLVTRHHRGGRLYTEVAKRSQKGLTQSPKPTAANIPLMYNRLASSLEFWEDARSWCGTPWWGKPRLDFPWAPPKLPSETLGCDLLRRPLPPALNDTQRMVSFVEDEKESSPHAPALIRVPRCSTAQAELSEFRTSRPRARLIPV
jgi:hypothetical protein